MTARKSTRKAAKNAPKKRTGRPPVVVDLDILDGLASILCTNEEMAAVLGCSVDTLTRRFADRIEKGRETGRASLRRMQFAAARKGNPAMLIWLGKQLLGQRDRRDVTSDDKPLLPGVVELPVESWGATAGP